MQEPLPQESKARTTIHDSFDCLQLVYFALGDALAPRQTESRVYRVVVSLDPSDKAQERESMPLLTACCIQEGTSRCLRSRTLQKGLQQAVDGLHI